jgi:hypothetical protein
MTYLDRFVMAFGAAGSATTDFSTLSSDIGLDCEDFKDIVGRVAKEAEHCSHSL